MNCNCNNSNNIPVGYVYNNVPCTTTPSSNGTYDSSIIMYTGANLSAIGVETNTSIETILSNINSAVAGISGIDWSAFNYFCLPGSITTAQEFAETISEYVCTSSSTTDEFIDTTFPDAMAAINSTIDTINEPSLNSCAFVGINPTDNVSAILEKLYIATCSLSESVNPSSANWNQCFVTSPLPSTITEGFDVIIDQICNIYATLSSVEALPTFDNTNTCLPSPVTSTDTLYDTVIKIRDYICELPSFDIGDIVWTSCLPNPNPSGGADLQSTIQTLVDYTNTNYVLRVTSWDPAYFDVSLSSPSDPCSGYTVSLQSGLGLDNNQVALNALDNSPNYLLSKMLPGNNISFDTTTTPGSVIIDSDAVDEKVKANAADTTSGYLIDKIAGQADTTSSISLVESYNSTTDKVDITPSINFGNLVTQILDFITNNGTSYSQLQTIICSMQPCPEGTERYISGIIQVSGDPVQFNLSFEQATPTLAMYSSGDVSATSGDVINTGLFQVTSATTSVTGVLTIVNNDSGASLPYNIYVTDLDDNPITGTTAQTGSISASSTLTINPFIYGSATNMVVHIELGTGTTTTSSTTTTTTTEF